MASGGSRAGPDYIAKTGSEGRARLKIQHRVFAPGTEMLLKMSAFRPDMRVLVIGSGCGDETIMIASLMDDDGHLVAVDKSIEQIEQARQAVKEASLEKKVTFINKTIEELTADDGQYDLILGRFVIPHLAEPKEAIIKLTALLKPGAVLASQEPIVSSCYSDPRSPALEKYLRLMLDFAKANLLDFDMAKTIPTMFASCGLVTDKQLWQPKVLGPDKSMVTMSAQECMPAILKYGLISLTESEQLIADIEKEVVNPENAVLFQCKNVLTVGRKPDLAPK